jgi:murein DD-endopeptidase MepM/ murein hydrolase activator NlpD
MGPLTKSHTILIARTGQEPITLCLRPLPILIGAAIALGIPLTWAGITVASIFQSNQQLTRRNQELSETATEVLSEINQLDAEIKTLKRRAGVSEDPSPEGEPEALNPNQTTLPQGGLPNAVPPETLLSLAQQRGSQLTNELQQEVSPALEETLAAEAHRKAAFPDGLPLQTDFRVSSEFGVRSNPFGRRNYEMHNGIDFVAPYGTPIHATADGTVTRSQNTGGFGKHVIIDHGYNYETLYAHMSELKVTEGQTIRRGEIVGLLGNTGRSSGPHLHYEVHRGQKPLNPRRYLKELSKMEQASSAAED